MTMETGFRQNETENEIVGGIIDESKQGCYGRPAEQARFSVPTQSE